MRRDPKDDSTAFIPGSEIRGMVRSVYEAATDSCMGILEDEPMNGRSTQFTKYHGLIKKEVDGWYLYETEIAYNGFIQHSHSRSESGCLSSP